jgi:hypothetical protein
MQHLCLRPADARGQERGDAAAAVLAEQVGPVLELRTTRATSGSTTAGPPRDADLEAVPVEPGEAGSRGPKGPTVIGEGPLRPAAATNADRWSR